MTSMAREAGGDISMADVRRAVIRHMAAVFGIPLEITDPAAMKALASQKS